MSLSTFMSDLMQGINISDVSLVVDNAAITISLHHRHLPTSTKAMATVTATTSSTANDIQTTRFATSFPSILRTTQYGIKSRKNRSRWASSSLQRQNSDSSLAVPQRRNVSPIITCMKTSSSIDVDDDDDDAATFKWGHNSDSMLHLPDMGDLSLDDLAMIKDVVLLDDMDRWGQSSDSFMVKPKRKLSILTNE